ncbi:MAG: glycosidase, partial [Alicyclobacillus sp.]|nr:glycosidase [Alicyclobacillus sp.]
MRKHRVQFPLGPFVRHHSNPILTPQGDTWEAKDLFNPAAIVHQDRVYLFYRAEDKTGHGAWNGTSRIGLAISEDGVNFERLHQPVIEPTEPYELPGGCEDPRVVEIDGRFFLTYTAFDGTTARLCLATSTDLVHWTKHGCLFPDWPHGPVHGWSKSGAIVPQQINGRYIMYFGDTDIWLASSVDGIHWTPQDDPVLCRRPGFFDSLL